jgi:hypothetical protein
MLYRPEDKGDFSEEFLAKKDTLTLSESFLAIKNFKRSATSVKPLLHYGFGLQKYPNRDLIHGHTHRQNTHRGEQYTRFV